MSAPPPIPTGHSEVANWIRYLAAEVRSLRPIAGPGEMLHRTTRGVVRGKEFAGLVPNTRPRPFYARNQGEDATWVSWDDSGFFENYWGPLPDTDFSRHYFALKAPSLQTRAFWDSTANEGKYDDESAYLSGDTITGGTSPQSGLLTVQSIGYGLLQSRILEMDGEHWTEFVTPTLDAPSDPLDIRHYGTSGYAGNSLLLCSPIPSGLFVCNGEGKITWDYTSGTPKPATTLVQPTDSTGDGWMPAGSYDVTLLDLNVAGRHWKRRDFSDEQIAILEAVT